MDEVGLLGVDAVSLIAIILRCDFMSEAKERTVQHDSILTGQLYLKELLETRSTARFRDVTRMSHDIFDELLLLLETHGGFEDSKYISTGEKLLIFILVLVGHSNRTIHERWQHSGSTVSLVVHQVATVMLKCQHLIIVPPTVLVRRPLLTYTGKRSSRNVWHAILLCVCSFPSIIPYSNITSCTCTVSTHYRLSSSLTLDIQRTLR